jgi:nuclear pore complex protein Nup93
LTFEPLRGVPDTDIEQFLRNEHETLVSLAIEESRMQTVQDFEASFEKSVQKDWARQKRKIMENMGQHSLAHLDSDVPGRIKFLI